MTVCQIHVDSPNFRRMVDRNLFREQTTKPAKTQRTADNNGHHKTLRGMGHFCNPRFCARLTDDLRHDLGRVGAVADMDGDAKMNAERRAIISHPSKEIGQPYQGVCNGRHHSWPQKGSGDHSWELKVVVASKGQV